MLPPVGTSSVQPTGPGSSSSYAVVNRPTLFPLGVSTASGQNLPSSVATSTLENDLYSLVDKRPDLFLKMECNRLKDQIVDLCQRRASVARALTALTGEVVPSLPPFLGGPSLPGSQ